MDTVMMFIAGEGGIIMHLVKPCKQSCADVITHLNDFRVPLFCFFSLSPKLNSDTDMPPFFFFLS